MPAFLLQIVGPDGVLARFPAGTKAGLERPLIEACTQAIVTQLVTDGLQACVEAIVAKGVGYFKSEAQVEQAIRDGLSETLDARLTQAIDAGITETLRALKEDTRYLVTT